MKTDLKLITRIAKIELNKLFYSPVAWLILLVFGVQVGFSFADKFSGILHYQEMGKESWSITYEIFGTYMTSITIPILKYIYLYIPLVTMGLMSREYQSGSIKLLFSSPIKNSSIILGKFLSMMIYGAVLVGIIGSFAAFSWIFVPHFDYSLILSVLLGFYLTILVYSAIGLFMSSITKYQVVAAIGTLAVLAFLNMVGNYGQNYEIIKDITYWLDISGRSKIFLNGLITSEDVLYFIIVIVLFLWLSIFRLNTGRIVMPLRKIVFKYIAIVFICFLCGYITTFPQLKFYYDVTYIKSNTLCEESQNAIKGLDGGLSITTYVNALDENFFNMLPWFKHYDYERFEKYIRFKPEMKMKYVYYYDKVHNPVLNRKYPNTTDYQKLKELCKVYDLDEDFFLKPEEIHKIINLKPEKNQLVRVLERENGKKEILRIYNDRMKMPTEVEISAVLRKLSSTPPLVAFMTGYGNRNITNYGGKGYYLFGYDKWFRFSLINLGFNTTTINLDKNDISDDVNVLVVSDIDKSMSDIAISRLNKYINKGGNLFILANYSRSKYLNKILSPLGIKLSNHLVVQENKYVSPNLVIGQFTSEGLKKFPEYNELLKWDYSIVLPTTVAIDYSNVKDFNVTSILKSSNDSWLEKETTDFENDSIIYNPNIEGPKQSYNLIVALNRKIKNKEQKIIISGDSDFISNGELGASHTGISASNYSIVKGSFRWFSNNIFPIHVKKIKALDNHINLPPGSDFWVNLIIMGLLPLLTLIFGIFLILRRQRK